MDMRDNNSSLNIPVDDLIEEFNQYNRELDKLIDQQTNEIILISDKDHLVSELNLLRISKKIRNLLKIGYVNGRERSGEYDMEGSKFYATLQLKRQTERFKPDLQKSLFLENIQWHKIKVREFIDELKLIEKFSLSNPKTPSDNQQQNEEPLKFDVNHDDPTGKIKVFISHKFIESDQKLARSLQESLKEKNIFSYVESRNREYDLVWGEKIKRDIESSDYLVAIITKYSQNAPSIHQEMGYALGVNVPVRIMAEEHEATGVLFEGKDVETFSRDHFEAHLDNIIKDVVKNGIRKKLEPQDKEELIQNVYEPCYNQMKNIFDQREHIHETPPDPWKSVSNRWKLKTETELKKLFENYTENHQIYENMWRDFANSFQSKKIQLGEIIRPAFEKCEILNKHGGIPLSQNSSINPSGLLENFKDAIFDDDINNVEEFYDILHTYAVNKVAGLVPMLEIWKNETPTIYFEILKLVPELVKYLDLRYTHQQVEQHKVILKKSIEELTFALEEKLR